MSGGKGFELACIYHNVCAISTSSTFSYGVLRGQLAQCFSAYFRGQYCDAQRGTSPSSQGQSSGMTAALTSTAIISVFIARIQLTPDQPVEISVLQCAHVVGDDQPMAMEKSPTL